jgi:glycosyltransferase involved in cell wall biosynthesis
MKVMVVNYPNWRVYEGGDSVTLLKTVAALRGLGIDVTECYDAAPNATGFDVVHIFNMRRYDETIRQVDAAKRSGAPVVLTPFYMSTGYADWAVAALEAILTGPFTDAQRPNLLNGYRLRQVTVTTAGGNVHGPTSIPWPGPGDQDMARAILNRVDCLLPNSLLELDRLRKDLQVVDTPFAVIPLGADADKFVGADPEPFVRRYGVRDFVLQVARMEPRKNQLGMVHALRDLDVPVVLVGKAGPPAYAELCRRHGPRNLTILPFLPAEELPSAYAAARVHVLANWTETCGLVSLEAALAGCSVVCSNGGHELEFFQDQVYYCDPVDLESIRRAVVRALANYDADAPRRQALRERVVRDYNWRRVAEMTLDVYKRVQASPRRG